jgi:hypothetical protein
MRGAPIRVPPIDPARVVAAAVRAPFALFWGIRQTAESLVWSEPPTHHPCPPPMHVYKISCEPPCYGGCGCGCGCRHG